MTWLVPLPIVLPLLGASLSVLLGRSRVAQRVVGITTLVALVAVSIAAAATDLACTSSPTLVRSENTGASYDCG